MAWTPARPNAPFSLDIPPTTPLHRAASAARPLLERVLGLTQLGAMYNAALACPGPTFESRALRALDIDFRVTSGERIPGDGPLLVVANHPTGALDGLVLAEAIRRRRPDVRVLANHVLSRIPELSDTCFFIDPFGGADAVPRSHGGLRSAHLWLRRGGALVMFPAGEVAWRQSSSGRLDSDWHLTLGRLAAATRARVLPVWVDGGNSRLFYAAGRLHPRLRTALLGRELLAARGSTVSLHVGDPMRFGPGTGATDPQAITAASRAAVDRLRETRSIATPSVIAAAVSPGLLDADVRALPATARLLSSGAFDVLLAGADALPHVLAEIGRLRELTFRAVGEGTGTPTDLDRFDTGYEHLFVWNRDTHEVVGAYRIGATDRIVAASGVEGLYTRTLFRYDEALIARLPPALELGRSFVRQEYQRSYTALLLLWKGIGQIVARNPRYRVLFGTVSISSRYQTMSQQLMRAFLAQHAVEPALRDLVDPLTPPPALEREPAVGPDLETMEASIAAIEGTGMPILLRQYLKLNARLLGFNVDAAFSDALDALMMVDLTRVPPAILQRYLGRDESRAFAAYHGLRAAA